MRSIRRRLPPAMSLPAWGGGVAFSPDQISGLVLWCEADNITGVSDTAQFTPWPDISGSSHDLAQVANADYRPTYHLNVQNGLPIVRFDGISQFMRVNYTQSQPLTVFVAADLTDIADTISVHDGYATGNTLRLYRSGANLSMYAGTGIALGAMPSGWHVITTGWSGTSSYGQIDNGAAQTGNAGTGTPSGLSIATYGALGAYANMDCGAVLIYNGLLSAGDVALVAAYLVDKWV